MDNEDLKSLMDSEELSKESLRVLQEVVLDYDAELKDMHDRIEKRFKNKKFKNYPEEEKQKVFKVFEEEPFHEEIASETLNVTRYNFTEDGQLEITENGVTRIVNILEDDYDD